MLKAVFRRHGVAVGDLLDTDDLLISLLDLEARDDQIAGDDGLSIRHRGRGEGRALRVERVSLQERSDLQRVIEHVHRSNILVFIVW